MSGNSVLTPEQIKRIEDKRKQALEKKAASEAAKRALNQQAISAIASLGPTGISTTSFYKSDSRPNSNQKPSVYKPLNVTISKSGGPDAKKLKTDYYGAQRSSASAQTASSTTASPSNNAKVITGLCKMVTRERFAVVAGYHKEMIEAFKTIPSKIYDIKTRNWNFLLKDHDALMSLVEKIRPSVSISPLPKEIKKIFSQQKDVDAKNVDLSCIDSKIMESLMPFQEEGVRFCISHHGRAMIADDMGLGKTIQALAVADYYKDDWPVLIVCPSSVRFGWAQAVTTWLPSVPTHQVVVMTTGKDFISDAKILIVSYDLLSKQGDELKKMKFNVLILDESHCLKNFKTNRSKGTLPFAKQAKRVLLLSGTPALSRPIELHFQLSLIKPNLLLSYQAYGMRYCNGQIRQWGMDYSGYSNMDELNLLLQECFMIRRLKVDVLTQLPGKFRQLVVLPASSVNTKMSQLRETEKSMQRANNNEKQGALLAYFHATSSVKLRGICDYVMDMVKDDKKFICFAHHKIVLDGICDKLDAGHFKYIKIDGSIDSRTRQDLCTQFQEDDRYRVAVLSITAANTGITLTAAHLVLFVELFWNPGVLLQAEDRAHRIGQKDCVVVQYLLAKGTADDHLWRLLQNKLSVLKKAGLNNDDLTKAYTTKLQDPTQPVITDFILKGITEVDDAEDALLAEAVDNLESLADHSSN